LGFTNINEVALKKFMVTSLGNMRAERKVQPVDMAKTENVASILAQFLNSMRGRHTLFTNRIHVSAGKPAKGSVVVRRDASKLDGLYVQIGLDDKIMRLSSFKVSEWMADKEMSRHLFIKALEKEFGTKVVNGRLGGGTDFTTSANEYLIEINLAGVNASKFIGD
jgi:hypothetical protein